jgi:hypothetical protein
MKIGSRTTLAGLVLVLASVLFAQSCATMNQMALVLANLQRLKFKLSGIHDFRLLGIDISGKSKISDFSAMDGLKALQAYQSKKLPVEFVLDVLAVNPNDGTGGTPKSTSTLTGLECRLLIDNKPTVVGNIDKPIEVPGTGQETLVPMRLSLDLLEFFGGQRYEDMIGLALAIGGKNRTATRIALDAQPRVSTPLGDITYPGRITIVATEFR